MKLTAQQYEQLLAPLAASRVANRKQGGMTLSYLEAWDVKAHLIRIFGFGGWSADVLSAELAFEEKDEKGRWNVGYKVVMRLRIFTDDEAGLFMDTTYTEAAVGSSTLPSRGEAHDMAIKTAESDALKRAAINLGTQFGLSLYDNGNKRDVIGHTLCPPNGYEHAPAPERTPVPPSLAKEITDCATREGLKTIWDTASGNDWLDESPENIGLTVRNLIIERLREIEEEIDSAS